MIMVKKYKAIKGIDSPIWVTISGGVIMAEPTNMSTTTYLDNDQSVFRFKMFRYSSTSNSMGN